MENTNQIIDKRKFNGGARAGAGRKELNENEKRYPVTIFVQGKNIKKNGGIKRLKIRLLEVAEK